MNDSDETKKKPGETEDLPPTASGGGEGVEKPGSEIGNYKILSVLGEGGCGVMLFNWIVINFVISRLHSYA